MTATPLDSSVQAEYADGYIHDETTLGDISPFGPFYQEVEDYDENKVALGTFSTVQIDKNVLNDILEKRPEADHGKITRFSVFYQNNRYDIDWRSLPDNARPIRFRHGFLTIGSDGSEERGWTGVDFGYQYTDADGKNIQEIRNL
jgi:hypothetical protein